MKQYVIMILSSRREIQPLNYESYFIKRDPYADEFFSSESEALEFIERYLAGFRESYIILPVYTYNNKLS